MIHFVCPSDRNAVDKGKCDFFPVHISCSSICRTFTYSMTNPIEIFISFWKPKCSGKFNAIFLSKRKVFLEGISKLVAAASIRL